MEPRELSEKMKGLLTEEFKAKLKVDSTLHFQIRGGYINVYYRGCSALKFEESGAITIASEYCKEPILNLNQWLEKLPLIKNQIDLFLAKPKDEREFQQLVVRDNNNTSIANDTDYFIVDIEYADTNAKARFDMRSIKWLSTSQDHKKPDNCKLAFIEMKYGRNSLGNLRGHFQHIYEIITKDKKELISQVKDLYQTQCALGLIVENKHSNKVEILEEPVEFILLFANFKPASYQDNLAKNLENIWKNEGWEQTFKEAKIELRFATASFMGYGLYDKCMLNYDEFMKLLKP